MIDGTRRAEGAGGASPSGPPQGISARKKGGAALLAALSVASPAAAEQSAGWAAFLQHCLTPMSDFALSQPTDLPHLRSLKNDGNGYSVYDGGGFEIWVTDGPDGAGDGVRFDSFCEIVLPAAGADIEATLIAWASEPETKAMWEKINETGPLLTLQSTTWREPKMQISLTRTGDQVRLRAQETDLES